MGDLASDGWATGAGTAATASIFSCKNSKFIKFKDLKISTLRRRWLCCDKLLFLDPDSDWSRCSGWGGSGGHLETRHGGLGLEVKLSPLGLLAAEAVKQGRDGHRGEGGGLLGERDAGQGQAEHQTLLDMVCSELCAVYCQYDTLTIVCAHL